MTSTVSVRLTEGLKEQLEAKAQQRNQTLSDFAKDAMVAALNGNLPTGTRSSSDVKTNLEELMDAFLQHSSVIERLKSETDLQQARRAWQCRLDRIRILLKEELSETVFCNGCGAEQVTDDEEVCGMCGTRFGEGPPDPSTEADEKEDDLLI